MIKINNKDIIVKPEDVRRAREKFKCVHCDGSGSIMRHAHRRDICPSCEGTGCKKTSVDEIAAYSAAEGEGKQKSDALKLLAKAEAERDKLRKALETFGFHHQYCDRKVHGPHYPCNCGFQAALQGDSGGGEG